MTFVFTVKRIPLEVSFETGSIAEGAGILQEQGTALANAFEAAASLQNDSTGASDTGGDATAPTTTTGAKRGRRSNAEKAAAAAAVTATPPLVPAPAPAPVTPVALPVAQAPAPISVPTAAQPAPLPTPAAGDVVIPDFLKRTDAAPVAPPPAAPPAPVAPAPQSVNTAPPTGVLAPLVIANLKARNAGATDGGKSLADWLVQNGIVMAGATFDEALAVIQFCKDEQLKPIANALGVVAA